MARHAQACSLQTALVEITDDPTQDTWVPEDAFYTPEELADAESV